MTVLFRLSSYHDVCISTKVTWAQAEKTTRMFDKSEESDHVTVWGTLWSAAEASFDQGSSSLLTGRSQEDA